jgi:hypothetical protein
MRAETKAISVGDNAQAMTLADRSGTALRDCL